MNFYWELTLFDGTSIEIPPEAVATVKTKWKNGQPIDTDVMMVPANQIKSFRQTSKPYGDQKLIEGAAQAFNTPIFKDGAMVEKYVSKKVTPAEWNKLSGIPAYSKLGSENGLIIVGFWLPVHQITDKLTEATPIT